MTIFSASTEDSLMKGGFKSEFAEVSSKSLSGSGGGKIVPSNATSSLHLTLRSLFVQRM
ncbi:MAG TPA: hypothetical protein VEL11_08475 [Candidatus Bathyarchaeia archaeon]|nr:hypothetical protein [Candidatus Bathyarchaeia archaeon]